jgi:hypothetical protein
MGQEAKSSGYWRDNKVDMWAHSMSKQVDYKTVVHTGAARDHIGGRRWQSAGI